MTSLRPALVCERVRAQVSLELDEELSELERRMLAAHLERCAECREYQEDLVAFTRELREAPFEQLSYPIEVHRPRRASLAWAQIGVAAAVAVAVFGTLTQLGPMSEHGRASSFGTPAKFQAPRQAGREVARVWLRPTRG